MVEPVLYIALNKFNLAETTSSIATPALRKKLIRDKVVRLRRKRGLQSPAPGQA
jgi:hypothetical protein